MKITVQQTEKLLKSNYSFSQLGFSMLLTRLKGLYAKDPSQLQHCMNEINLFLEKFDSLMKQDHAIFEKL